MRQENSHDFLWKKDVDDTQGYSNWTKGYHFPWQSQLITKEHEDQTTSFHELKT